MATASSLRPDAPDLTLVTGKFLTKLSRQPVRDIEVALFDLDAWADPENPDPVARMATTTPAANDADPLADLRADIAKLYKAGKRAGSATTSVDGTFVIHVTPRDLSVGRRNEQRADLVLIALAPDEPGLPLSKRLLHLSLDVRFNAASSEATIILLPEDILTAHGIPFGQAPSPNDEDAKQRAKSFIQDHSHDKTFNDEVAAYHGKANTRELDDRKKHRQLLKKKLAPELVADPKRGVFVSDGTDIRTPHVSALQQGITNANTVLERDGGAGVPINLYLTPDDLTALSSYLTGATTDEVDIPGEALDAVLFRTGPDNPGAILVHNSPIAKFCGTETDQETCARLHTDMAHPQTPMPTVTPPTSPEPTALTAAAVLDYLDRLVRDIPSPDSVLRPELKESRKAGDLNASVENFSLQKGPAEVPAFHDLNAVQLAFDHVWQQLFDESIPNLAYTANTLGQTRFGVDGLFDSSLVNGVLTADPSLILTPVEVPSIVTRYFDVTTQEYNDLSFTKRQELKGLAEKIEQISIKRHTFLDNLRPPSSGIRIADQRFIQLLTEQGERLIDSVRTDDVYTLHKTLRELQARLTSKYEFTVFAANKDYHSVNFGLLNTYRQLWEPLTYQAGDLLKSIPLAPKEERKYSIKVTRHEKRDEKEAKKNNIALTNEQASTSRAEADIMAKTQQKTTFGMSAEGQFQIGVYSGTGKTSFGVEAVSESAQTRKDFHEALLKAVQDYKTETTTEVTTESELTSETDESGVITNVNDERAVTFFFYELQKRYRVSEQIYRVMPVVFVAQEVPQPDEITPAWVLTHDWILNRVILDDSFRPTLRYLASNSVGDDFALRELRKNLRQQRTLVETLRIEFSAASHQADNRYAALEGLIAQRISAEEAESSDGLFSDVASFIGGSRIGSFFAGGGSADPEAAKARELAAKDAHQYALEKAEKAATALKQEANNLQQLTTEYNRTLQTRLDNETMVKRLLVHLRNNIFYYMQAIWTMEPPDQRLLRLHNVQVPVLELETRSYRVTVRPEDPDLFARFREPGTERHRAFMHGTLKHLPDGSFPTEPLAKIADLGKVVCCIGNYLGFALNQHNALTEFMAAPYVDSAFGAMDPEDLSNVTLEQYSRYVCCLRHRLKDDEFDALKPQLVKWLGQLLASPLRNGDEIVVPTGSLFIESLVDPNSMFELFKEQHRELDVNKVQEEVRHASLENLRLASRLLHNEREDPDIEKKIVVESDAATPAIDVDNP